MFVPESAFTMRDQHWWCVTGPNGWGSLTCAWRIMNLVACKLHRTQFYLKCLLLFFYSLRKIWKPQMKDSKRLWVIGSQRGSSSGGPLSSKNIFRELQRFCFSCDLFPLKLLLQLVIRLFRRINSLFWKPHMSQNRLWLLAATLGLGFPFWAILCAWQLLA